MSAILSQASRRAATRYAGGYGRFQQRRWASEASEATEKSAKPLASGAKRDPELYILLAVMSGAFGLAGLYFGRKPTAAVSEAKVAMADGAMPWQTDAKASDAKYQYHPGGDRSRAKKDAPSALNSVIVPNVNLPAELHEKYNKWGKEGY